MESFIDDIDVELEKVCSGFIQRYINCESQGIQDTESDIIENAERVRLGLVFGPLLVDILKIWESAAKETFEKHSYWLKPLLFNMIESTNCDLRTQLKQVFMKQLL